jgi:hypothetical protein
MPVILEAGDFERWEHGGILNSDGMSAEGRPTKALRW